MNLTMLHLISLKCIFAAVLSLSHIRFFGTPWTVARQAPLSMGFSRQEYWSDLPCPPLGDLPNAGIKPGLQFLFQADSLPSEPPRKSKNTGVGSLWLFQGIFLTQESNQGLLHCRQILYQLSYQGSPSALVCPNQNDKSFINLLPSKVVYIIWNVARYRKEQKRKKASYL